MVILEALAVMDFGCFMYFCVCTALLCTSLLIASRHGHPAWLGLITAIVASLAALSGYGGFLTLIDWYQKSKYPNRIGVSNWVIAAIWVCFLATTALSLMLFKGLTIPAP